MTADSKSEAVKPIHYLAAALKAPRITEATARLAEQARDGGWSFEDYLAAVLEREVSARNASGGAQLQIRAAGFPTRKTFEDFEWDVQPAIRQQVASLASGGSPYRSPQHCAAGPARYRQDASGHRAGHHRGPPQPPRFVRHGH